MKVSRQEKRERARARPRPTAQPTRPAARATLSVPKAHRFAPESATAHGVRIAARRRAPSASRTESGAASGRPSRILLVEDQPIVADKLVELLATQPDLTHCGTARTAATGFDLIQRVHPDLAIVELSLRNSSGLDLLKNVRTLGHPVKFLIYSRHDCRDYADRVICAGAQAYVCKYEPTATLLAAIRQVLAGQTHLCPVAVTCMSHRRRQCPARPARPQDGLSDREVQVLELIGNGQGTHDIADQLHVSVKTIETYRARLKEKLALPDADALRRYAIAHVHGQPGKG